MTKVTSRNITVYLLSYHPLSQEEAAEEQISSGYSVPTWTALTSATNHCYRKTRRKN